MIEIKMNGGNTKLYLDADIMYGLIDINGQIFLDWLREYWDDCKKRYNNISCYELMLDAAVITLSLRHFVDGTYRIDVEMRHLTEEERSKTNIEKITITGEPAKDLLRRANLL